jgi:acyl carrier protein
MASVEERLKKIIADQLGAEESEITPSTDLIEDLRADSLDLVELQMVVEEHFNIDIPDDDIEHLLNFRDAKNYIEKRLI